MLMKAKILSIFTGEFEENVNGVKTGKKILYHQLDVIDNDATRAAVLPLKLKSELIPVAEPLIGQDAVIKIDFIVSEKKLSFSGVHKKA